MSFLPLLANFLTSAEHMRMLSVLEMSSHSFGFDVPVERKRGRGRGEGNERVS